MPLACLETMSHAMALGDFLERAKLSRHKVRLEEEGYADATDVAQAADEDLAKCGLKPVELKRLRRTLMEIATEIETVTEIVGYASCTPLEEGEDWKLVEGAHTIMSSIQGRPFKDVTQAWKQVVDAAQPSSYDGAHHQCSAPALAANSARSI